MAESVINVVGLSNPKSNSKTNWKVISAIVGIIVLALGVIAGIILVRQNQDAREQAACVAQCPGDDNVLRSCHDPAEGDTLDSKCNSATIGRIEVCGRTASTAKEYCCTTNGWKTNLTLCSSAQSTPTATATSTSAAATTTGTSKATSTATSRSTSTAKSTPAATIAGSATPFPVPKTGAEWPTIIGAGLGIVLLVISLGLAL